MNHSALDRIANAGDAEAGIFFAKLSASLDWTNQALTVTLNATSEALTLFTQRQEVVLVER
ncbi:MAG: hypothetical protein EON54_17995 [Alcaligenaceae bacterium]|nr:MAG: hypothetical protein EON54_17995 [Alcaligenaceae bacterium]